MFQNVTFKTFKILTIHVQCQIFKGAMKMCFLSLEAVRAKRGLALGVKVNAFKSLQIQDSCGNISLKPVE